MVQFPDDITRFPGQQAGLEGNKGHRMVSVNDVAGRGARLGVQPGGHIQRNDGGRVVVSVHD